MDETLQRPPLAGAAERGRRALPQRQRTAAYRRDGFACVKCGRVDGLQAHHIVPWRHGGTHELDNLATLCVGCHHDWDGFEEVTELSFEEWLLVPPSRLLAYAWLSGALDPVREALEGSWALLRALPPGQD